MFFFNFFPVCYPFFLFTETILIRVKDQFSFFFSGQGLKSRSGSLSLTFPKFETGDSSRSWWWQRYGGGEKGGREGGREGKRERKGKDQKLQWNEVTIIVKG